MAADHGGDGLIVTNYKPADFECQAVVANATAAGSCALACQRTQHGTGRRRTASHKAMACGTLALLRGQQAAAGQPARLRLGAAPRCKT